MKKTCAVSGREFEITDEDQKVYEKLDLPLPTLCPDERNRRRMCWRNDRAFYHRKCSGTGKSIISIYTPDVPFPVYESSFWWGDEWDAQDFAQEFDFSQKFFPQWQNLMNKVPRRAVDLINCENSEYCNYCGDDKNCYLDIAGEANEDCYFNLFTKYSKNCADNTFVYNSELLFESINCYDCFDCRWSMYLENCNGCDFCFDCKGCADCIFCWNLRRKKHCIFNEQLTKEEFEKRKAELRTDSHEHVQFYQKKFEEMRQDSATHKNMMILNSENVDGNHINHSKNTHYAWNVAKCEDSSYLYDVLEATNCRDLNYSLYKPELSVELISTLNLKMCVSCMASHFSNDLAYCDHCENSHDLFGCIGIKHGEYCIFNKQYSEEEYFALRAKIVQHMKNTGEWGEFFPLEMSPHAYNETVAHEYYPLEQAAVLARGWRWKNPDKKEYKRQETKLPDLLADTDDSICEQVLQCEETGKNFKIIPQELKFYRTMNVALPRLCPDARHLHRMKMRSPRALFDRDCAKCGVKMKTTFHPNRSEKVLCESCFTEQMN